ncbi:hypothetical protein BDZ91DRAFT_51489 [Kalaharituber pfeilii]|nr:hypothetical protein BDZ91DRAFT_51489 [Kalaharituber pfeilii]
MTITTTSRTVHTLPVDFKTYYRSAAPPNKVDEPTADWVSMVATPAFRAYKDLRKNQDVKRFATIGTGSGLDAIIASEVFNLEHLALTDLHHNVLGTAARNVVNVLGASKGTGSTVVTAAYGDLLTPLIGAGVQFDLIYENLPNIPIEATEDEITQGQTSATYVEERKEKLPAVAQSNLLALHFLAIKQGVTLLIRAGGSARAALSR